MNLPGVVASMVGALVLLAGAVVMAYEAWALGHGWTPITGYVRAAIARWPGWAFALAIGVGLLLGHFFWP